MTRIEAVQQPGRGRAGAAQTAEHNICLLGGDKTKLRRPRTAHKPLRRLPRSPAPAWRPHSTSVVVVPPPPDHEDAEPSPYLGEENTERYLRYCETWLGGAGMMGSLCVWRGFCPGVKAEKCVRSRRTALRPEKNCVLPCQPTGGRGWRFSSSSVSGIARCVLLAALRSRPF